MTQPSVHVTSRIFRLISRCNGSGSGHGVVGGEGIVITHKKMSWTKAN